MTSRRARSALAHLLMRLSLWATSLRTRLRIARMAKRPMAWQLALLKRMLQDNRGTTFGHMHGFGSICDHAGFAQAIPIADYEQLREYIEAEIQNGEAALTAAPPLRYVRTSGTTGKAKDVPLTTAHLAALRRIHRMAVASQYRTCPEGFAGGILAIVSPADEGQLENGKAVGAASGVVAGNTPPLLRDKFVLPGAVLTINDSKVKYLLILRLALARPDITYVGTANPSTLLTMMHLYREYEDELIADISTGTFFLDQALTPPVRASLHAHLFAAPERAKQIQSLRATSPNVRLIDLLPSLKLVVTWTCASAGVAIAALRRELGDQVRILELGYVSSEFRGTITIGKRAGSGFPTLDTHFFEFVERDVWDNRDKTPLQSTDILTLDRLRKGVEYTLIVTTPSGLYRYFINDLVRVRGFLRNTPLLQFVQKGKGVTSITGEKLYEAQVLEAVQGVMRDAGQSMRFMMMLADEEASRYCLYIERDATENETAAGIAVDVLAERIDTKMQLLNIEYHAKRESGRLLSLQAAWLAPDTLDNYRQHCVARGQREGQFKTIALAYKRNFGFDLDACCLTSCSLD